jgi:hypothetical protein
VCVWSTALWPPQTSSKSSWYILILFIVCLRATSISSKSNWYVITISVQYMVGAVTFVLGMNRSSNHRVSNCSGKCSCNDCVQWLPPGRWAFCLLHPDPTAVWHHSGGTGRPCHTCDSSLPTITHFVRCGQARLQRESEALQLSISRMTPDQWNRLLQAPIRYFPGFGPGDSSQPDA